MYIKRGNKTNKKNVENGGIPTKTDVLKEVNAIITHAIAVLFQVGNARKIADDILSLKIDAAMYDLARVPNLLEVL